MKKLLGYGLLAFVMVSVAFALFHKEAPSPAPTPEPEASAPAPSKRPKAAASKPRPSKQVVIARYCHGSARCSNCLKIEGYSKEAIETGFRKELASGSLRFELANIDEPANRRYVQDYGLYTKSLVLIAETDGKEVRHKVLNNVWNHLSDKTAFMAYVRAETEGFLKP
ncbi:MAG: nitrophenyl compound nitroreductase subunit ArsF family protein [Elusimicrobiota bacterium]|jgi:hypothetical protein